ncbi:MAG: TSUP family transporter [Eubacteriales bacterium]|jgi:hypothetical protein
MEYVYFALAGLAGGLLGGMGMGGGTVLIPLLSIFMNVDQHAAQALNLISFLPMAVVALVIHFKNGLVEYKKSLFVIVPALLFAVLGCFAAKNTEGELLGKLFGGFLAALSVFQFCSVFRKEE